MESLRQELQALEDEMIELSPYLSDGEDFVEDNVDAEAAADTQSLKSTATLIVVDNVPKIPMSKFEKLTNVLKKIYTQFGKIEKIEMPADEVKGKTLGFALIEFASESQAKKAVTNTNGWKLDKKHIFVVNHFADVRKFLTMGENFSPPEMKDYAPLQKLEERTGNDLRSWLGDEFFRDQFVVRYASETEVNWCEPMGAPTMTYGGERQKAEGKNWCEMYVAWSPNGTYLATFHHQGIVLWGGSSFKKILRYVRKEKKEAKPGVRGGRGKRRRGEEKRKRTPSENAYKDAMIDKT